MVLEYVGEMSLSQVLKKGPLSLDQIRDYFKDIVKGIQTLHETFGVIHRDIKPENLLITEEGRIKIGDFGWSGYINSPTNEVNNLTRTVGSNYYFSPEVCIGTGIAGKPGDIWALGVTLYYMLFRDYPFKAGANEFQVLYKNIQYTEPEYPDSLKDERILKLLKSLLIKEPDKRATINDIINNEWLTNI